MYAILKETKERMGFTPDLVEDIAMGNVRVTHTFLLGSVLSTQSIATHAYTYIRK